MMVSSKFQKSKNEDEKTLLIYTKTQIQRNKKIRDEVLQKIQTGAVYVYPTDTIYGIGCIVKNKKSVDKVRSIKQNAGKVMSIIVPSKSWIKENTIIDKANQDELKKLPGPYTLILKPKTISQIIKNANPVGTSIGVRIPKHWFSRLISNLNEPIITTSANISGQEFTRHITELDSSILENVDFLIDDGIIDGKPSTIIDLTGEKPKILRK